MPPRQPPLPGLVKKLSKAQAGRLGGLASADALTPEQRAVRSARAGSATKAGHGRDYYVRLALKRWGHKIKLGERLP